MTTATDIIEVDGRRALELLREVVAEKGADYVYTNEDGSAAGFESGQACAYAFESKYCPACLIGYVFHKLGVTVDELLIMGTSALPNLSGMGAMPARLRLNKEAVSILGLAQAVQDKGDTWGKALEFAEERAKAFGINVEEGKQ